MTERVTALSWAERSAVIMDDTTRGLRLHRVAALVAACLTVMLLVSHSCASGADLPANEVRLSNGISITGLYSITTEEMAYLLNLSDAEELTPARIRSGIKRAFLKEIFDDIVFQREHDGRIAIRVKERRVVQSVEIEGLELLSARTVRSLFGVSPGERVTSPAIERRLSQFKASLAERGFPRAEVAYDLRPREGNRTVLRLMVNEGTPERVMTISVTSTDAEMSPSLPLSVGDILDRRVLDDYRSKWMAEMKKDRRVKSRFEYSYSNGDLSLVFDAGRKVLVEFEGNSAISASGLMREITFYEIDDISDELIEEAVTRMTARYRREGYAFARIIPTISEPEGTMTITFFVHEGSRYVVDSVSFSGNTLDGQRLGEILYHKKRRPYDPNEVESDRVALSDLYQSLGFLGVVVKEPAILFDGLKVSLHYEIEEGDKVLIDSIVIRNSSILSKEDLLGALKIKKGQPYNAIDIIDSSRIIRDLYHQKGYLDTSVAVSTAIDHAKAIITFDVSEGDSTLLGKRIVVGNKQTRLRIITREFVHADGEPFSLARIYEDRARLFRTGLFNDIEVTPIETEHGHRDVIYRLSESPPGEFEFGLGYGNFEKFRGFFNVGYNNLWGLNKRISLRTELSELNSRILVAYDEPWLISREIPMKVLLLAEKRKELNYDNKQVLYRLNRYLASVGTDADLSRRVKAQLYYSGSITETSDVQPDVVLSRQDVGTLFISAVRTGLIYDSRNNTFTPSRGILAGVALEVASSLLLSETDYGKLSMNFNLYRSVSDWLVGALSLRGGVAAGYRDTSELPIDKRFFLGGRTTVRGYKEDSLGPRGVDGNPTGGNAFLMGNFELRATVWKALGTVAFVDMGNVWQRVADMDLRQIRFTAGLGLRYNTPVGPLSVDYGVKLSRLEGESRGTLYFTIGNAF